MSSFHDFPLHPATLAVLATMHMTEPTPIQAQAIPVLLAGIDLVGQSATGSGKTLAYGIPLVERIAHKKREVQALVLVPTRELALQVHTVLSTLATSRRLSTTLLVGGRPYGNQISALRYGSHIVVGTPGRVKDHLDRGTFALSQVRLCVLDEADQMLDHGFAPIIEEILATTPDTRHMAFFSATIPDGMAKLMEKFLHHPVTVDTTPAPGTQSTIEQVAYQVPQGQKIAALCTLLRATKGQRSLIFGRTKYGVERLGQQLSTLGFRVATLHGNKSQHARDQVLSAFRTGQVHTLLATNVASRGLDIEGICQVINYDLPEDSDVFTHRVGRTGRMGQQGKAITLLSPSDVPNWRRLVQRLGQAVALQRLTLDEQALVPDPLAPLTQQHERTSEPQPVQGSKPFSPDHQRGTLAQPKSRRERTSERKTRPSESVASQTLTGQQEDLTLPKRPGSSKASSRTGKQASIERTMGKHNGSALTAKQPHQRTVGRKPRITATRQPRRAAPSRRLASH